MSKVKIRYKKSLVWVRRDLRLLDHAALSHATHESDGVAVVFIFDPKFLNNLNKTDKRITFIYDSLLEIDEELQKHGSKLIVRFGDPVVEIPKLIQELKAEALYYNEDYESYALSRDKKISNILKKQEVSSHSFKDQVIFSTEEVLKPDGSPYQMFTPYKRTWLKKLKQSDFKINKVKKRFLSIDDFKNVDLKICTLEELGYERVPTS